MAEYDLVAAQLARVRRAWKRTAGLSGVVVVVLEAAGMLALAVLVDVLYHPGLGGRAALLLMIVTGLGYLVARHVVQPMARRIPDEQMALYVEERNPAFEGALLSAAEFGPAGGATDEQGAIVAAIVDEAVERAKRLDLRSAVDLTRLRKYGLAAAAVVGLYLVVGLVAPDAMGRHVTRVLTPWRAPEGDDGPAGPRNAAPRKPVEITLSTGDTRLLRGTPFELEAELSRAPDVPVLFHFRSRAEIDASTQSKDEAEWAASSLGDDESAWRTLRMDEIEKVHGFRVFLPDVNKDLAFFVSTGESRTPVHGIAVYDPLRLRGFVVKTIFPEYLGLRAKSEEQATGDVSVPEGSTVTVRILTNGVLAGGTLAWADGEEQPLETGPRATSAAATFRVTDDRTYRFEVRDENGQELGSEYPALVHAIKDTPPTLAVKEPMIDVTAHPLSEVRCLVDAKDDWGVSGLDLVCRVGLGERAKSARMPLRTSERGPEGRPAASRVEGRLDLLLEDFNPRLEPGEVVAYHFEARDRKGHVAMSDIYFITVTPFEVWGTWRPLAPEAGHGVGHKLPPTTIEKYVAAAWHLEAQRDAVPRDEYEKACERLAEQFVDGDFTLWEYVRTPPKE
ncbi:MAG: DUF4175 family protein [Planctomycetota bacterium]|jgi:hypothetical protein